MLKRHPIQAKLPMIAALALVGGCSAFPLYSTHAVSSGTRLHSSVVLDDVRITPLAVLQDSRCPSTVECIHAGTVRIAVLIESRGWRVHREMELDMPEPVNDGELTLTRVTPTAREGVIQDRDYRFNFDYEANQRGY